MKVLDACCGTRMMWKDKKNPVATFIDIRNESHTLCDNREISISPDIVADFTEMPFEDEEFDLVVFDPPHLKHAGENSWLRKKYGVLPVEWRVMLNDGMTECMRVLKPGGTIIFKWNEDQVKIGDALKAIPFAPLFGHPTGRKGLTHWMVYGKTAG